MSKDAIEAVSYKKTSGTDFDNTYIGLPSVPVLQPTYTSAWTEAQNREGGNVGATDNTQYSSPLAESLKKPFNESCGGYMAYNPGNPSIFT